MMSAVKYWAPLQASEMTDLMWILSSSRLISREPAVGVRGKNMEVNVVLAEGFLNGVGSLIVEDAESGGCTVLL